MSDGMKTCIVTGAASGIGQATAIALCNEGLYENIVLVGRSVESLSSTLDAVKNSQVNIHAIGQDIGEFSSLPVMVDDIYKKFHSIDALLNIAGYTEPSALLSTTLENFRTTYHINVFSVFILIKECVKYMKLNRRSCKILNVASTAGMTPRPGWLGYASSKAAIISMSATLEYELAEYGISVYCVSPGRCATKLRKRLAPEEDPALFMQPEDVARVICDLMNENELCLSGQNIVVQKNMRQNCI